MTFLYRSNIYGKYAGKFNEVFPYRFHCRYVGSDVNNRTIGAFILTCYSKPGFINESKGYV